jgi:hypothetical protein
LGLIDHWHLDRKLRETYVKLGAGEDEARRVTALTRALLARTWPGSLFGRSHGDGPALGQALDSVPAEAGGAGAGGTPGTDGAPAGNGGAGVDGAETGGNSSETDGAPSGNDGAGVGGGGTGGNSSGTGGGDPRARSPLAVILDNYEAEDFRQILGINFFEDAAWFNKEAFEEALFYVPLFLLSGGPGALTGEGPSAAGGEPAELWLKRLDYAAEMANRFARAEAASGYRLDGLIEALAERRPGNGKAKKPGGRRR